MSTPPPRSRLRNALSLFRRYLGRGLLCVLTGCRCPALPYTAEPGCVVPHRNLVAAHQLVRDTAVEATHWPLQTCRNAVSETADHLCALLQGDLGKRIVLPLQGPPAPLSPCPECLDLKGLEGELRALTGNELDPANVQLHVDGHEALTALEDLIAQATKSIDVIMFQWESDPLGEEIAARLAARAGPGLRVRVLIDGAGNLYFNEPESCSAPEANRVIAALARHPYVEVVRIRNPFGSYDHRKLVLIDGRLVWTGGRNFTSPAFFEHHDLSFVFGGPLVCRLQQHFNEYWQRQDGPATPPAPRGCETPRGTVTQAGHEAVVEHALPQPNTWARMLYSEPGCRQISAAVYRAVDLAKHRIYVENVYLTDSRLVYKLAQARRRGVDVRVVLTVHSTTEMINRSNRVVANRLLASGVRVYLYPGMTHVKAITVDGCWAYIGTGNLDALSLRHNRELGLSVSGCALLAQLEERLFLPDLRPQWELRECLKVGIADYFAEFVASVCL
jgi:cardiolipin synthase